METNEELKIKEEAILFAKSHKKEIANKFTDTSLFPPDPLPVSVFMAGSPGAGKTEFSKRLVEQFEIPNRRVVRIDPDDFRSLLPNYNGTNSFLFQGAVSIITDRILDNLFHQKQSFILDGTCSHYNPAVKNIERSLNHNRRIYLFFVYQHPKTAWGITKIREQKEGRNISKEIFIEEFLSAQETVTRLKEKFKEKIILNFVDKETLKETVYFQSDVDSISEALSDKFTKEELYSILK